MDKQTVLEMKSSSTYHRYESDYDDGTYSTHLDTAEQDTKTIAILKTKGGLKTIPFIIANEAFEKVASIGLHANMILYLKDEYHLSVATATNILFLWNAISNFCPTVGAFLSDSYLGRYRVIALGTTIAFLGTVVLWITAIFPQLQPPPCVSNSLSCQAPHTLQLSFLIFGFTLMSIGAGGVRPCSLAFGADQFDNPNNPNNESIRQTFFNWYYVSVGVAVMISITVIVYLQTKFGYVVGFGVPTILILLAAIFFVMGSSLYIKVKANKSLLTGFAQVISAARKNKHLAIPPADSDGRYLHKKGSKLVAPSEKLSYLNKACIIKSPEMDLKKNGTAKDPWSLCTVQQVETLKALLKVIPIWSTGIILAVTISQHTFPVLQAATMDRHLSKSFAIPPGSFGVFAIIALTLFIPIYDRVLIPIFSKITKNPSGLTMKQRMGTGLILSCLSTGVAGYVENMRRRHAIDQGLTDTPFAPVKMSAMWLVPQYALIGLAESFNAIGQIEFFYSQFPKSMSSIGVALFTLGMGVGNLVGSLIVSVMDSFTKRGGKASWVSNNLNKGHYDYYYWVLTVLSVGNFFYYLICSWCYGSEKQQIWDEECEEEEKKNDQDMERISAMGSPLVYAI